MILPAEMRIPHGLEWSNFPAILHVKREVPTGSGDASYRVEFPEGVPPEVTPGLSCVVFYYRPGKEPGFFSSVITATGDTGDSAAYVRIPGRLFGDKRLRRFNAGVRGLLTTAERETEITVVDVTDGFHGLGILSETPLELKAHEKVLVTFPYQGQEVSFKGMVMWGQGSRRYGIRVPGVKTGWQGWPGTEKSEV